MNNQNNNQAPLPLDGNDGTNNELNKELEDGTIELEGNSNKQSSFISDERSKESIQQISGEVEIAAPDRRFKKSSKGIGRNESGKNKQLENEFKRQNKKQNKIKRNSQRIKNIKMLFRFDGNNILFSLIKKLFGLVDVILNIVTISAMVIGLYWAIKYIIDGNYYMVAACCLFIFIVAYVNEKIQ